MDVSQLSDAQLRDELKQYGIITGPVVGTTRNVYEKKLVAARKKGAPTPSAASKPPAPTPSKKSASPSRTASSTRSSSRGRKSATTRSESEERSDTEMEPVVTPSRSKPVVSTPKKKEKVIVTAPAKPTPSYPIPGLNTSMSKFNSSFDKPGHTPPRSKVVPKTPSTRPNLNVSSFSASRSRNMLENEPMTSGDEDDHEESSRFVSPSSSSFLTSFGSTKRTAVKRSPVYSAMDSMKKKAESSFSFLRKKPTLDFDDAPLSSYDMQVGGRHTRVVKDPKTGQMKVSQSVSTAYDISRLLLIILSIFLAILFVAYLVTAQREVVVGSFKTVVGAAQDTVSFVYNYAIFPLLLVGLLAGGVATIYLVYTRRNAAVAREEEALFQLIDQITDKVRESYENGEETISIPHVRDQIFPPAKRRGAELARWERAVEFVNEKESRIVTEAIYRRGVEVPSWKWIGAEKKQGWRGSGRTDY